MEILKVIKEGQNPLFKRKEIELEASSNITPSLKDTLEALSIKFSVKPEAIKVKGIRGKFGSNTFTISANIYESKEEKDKLEIKKKREIELEKKEQEVSSSESQTKTEPASEEKPVEEKAE